MPDLAAPSIQRLDGKVAVVTGGRTGLGAGIVLALASVGARVAVLDLPSQAAGYPAGCELLVPTDVSDAGQVDAAFTEVERVLGGVDVLVNNAGIYPNADLLSMTPEQWDATIAVNLRGGFLCTQRAARSMVGRESGGSIVLIGSTEALTPAPAHAHYAASKAGLLQFGRAAALELGRYGIRVNTVSPGLVNRPTLAADWPDGLGRFVESAPLGRPGEPAEIADACVFLAGDGARWITGAHLVVDGGVLVSPAF
jgi:NAD(P)-dependent dehydrogenase (short-subunit alcohol dehydrogenase family)